MKEYKYVKKRFTLKNTENELNLLAREGWKVVYNYTDSDSFLMERELKQ